MMILSLIPLILIYDYLIVLFIILVYILCVLSSAAELIIGLLCSIQSISVSVSCRPDSVDQLIKVIIL